MHSFKKALLSSLAFILVVVIASVAFVTPYFNAQMYYCNDRKVRESYAGTIDTLFLGASQSVRAFVPEVIDKKLGTSSYVIGGVLYTWNAKEEMLKEEIDRNPFKRVYIEVAYNNLQRGNETGLEGNRDLITRLNSPLERVRYIFRETSVKEYDDLYLLLLDRGYEYFDRVLNKKSVNNIDPAARGYYAHEYDDLTIADSKIVSQYNMNNINPDFNEGSLETIDRIVKMCTDRGIEVTLVVTPVSDALIWIYKDWNVFSDELKMLSEKYNCKLYDFNLMKNRYESYNDNGSFYEYSHMSKEGAKVFGENFAEVILAEKQGKNTDELFYSSYDEVKKDSPYMAKYNELKK